MENASKALIIAGAILLAILIIGLGMFIYQQAADAMKTDAVDELAVQEYNSKFLSYDKENLSGSQARQLCTAVIQHNLTRAKSDSSLYIEVLDSKGNINNSNDAGNKNAATMNSTITTIRNNIKSGKTYTVTFGYDAKTGYIVEVKIVESTTK